MSQQQPNPEKRQRMVDSVTKDIMHRQPLDKAPSELDELRQKRDDDRTKVFALLKPTPEAAVILSTADPLYAHCATGLMTLLLQAHKTLIRDISTPSAHM